MKTKFETKWSISYDYKTSDGFFFKRDYGKYRSGLLWIYKDGVIYVAEDEDLGEDLIFLRNAVHGTILWIARGNFGQTKNDTNAFWFDPHGSYILICVDCGGGFKKSLGYADNWVLQKAIYYHRVVSKCGEIGLVWIILDLNDITQSDNAANF
ncbi:MAG: hypothetical protein KatS3mg096_649 [Candidatus Parcubacteria bacterium]|nr:MAG: hypothetical protein KatS3mg035_2289 [Bacteroidia bacterium]GIW67781.1 MAG: hypothetical protein KatS3mg096_649 [Candidatus Parcubacteria bacterium]